MEIELKYAATRDKAMSILPSDAGKIDMTALYFDTEDRRLGQRGISVRGRMENESCIATMKWKPKGEAATKVGLYLRGEVNLEVDRSWMEKPDLAVFINRCEACTDMVEALDGEVFYGTDTHGFYLFSEAVKPLIRTEFTRYESEFEIGEGIRAVLSYDEGRIIAGDKSEPISEIEAELVGRDDEEAVEALKTFGKDLEADFGLVPLGKSKYARGLALLKVD